MHGGIHRPRLQGETLALCRLLSADRHLLNSYHLEEIRVQTHIGVIPDQVGDDQGASRRNARLSQIISIRSGPLARGSSLLSLLVASDMAGTGPLEDAPTVLAQVHIHSVYLRRPLGHVGVLKPRIRFLTLPAFDSRAEKL